MAPIVRPPCNQAGRQAEVCRGRAGESGEGQEARLGRRAGLPKLSQDRRASRGGPPEPQPGGLFKSLWGKRRRTSESVHMVTEAEVRAVAAQLPRAYEVYVRGRLKFRVGQIVFLAFAKDGATIGLGFDKE